MTPLWRLSTACLLVTVGACGGGDSGTGPPPVTAGEITLVLSGGGSTDGAVLLRVSGGPVEGITPVGALTAVGTPVAGGAQFRAVLAGALVNGDVARIRVPDVGAAAEYSVVIEQVADGTTFALLDPAGRAVTVRR